MKQSVKIKITGQVQEVGYRKFAQKQAQTLGIEGTIQNLDDQSVIIYVCGDATKLDQFIDLLYKGPNKSKIADIQIEPLLTEKSFRGVFRILDRE
ncbi:MAG: acylphosphatase [bacterium]